MGTCPRGLLLTLDETIRGGREKDGWGSEELSACTAAASGRSGAGITGDAFPFLLHETHQGAKLVGSAHCHVACMLRIEAGR
eukprot:1144426-Pelagomonas_calceolata.AAC.6